MAVARPTEVEAGEGILEPSFKKPRIHQPAPTIDQQQPPHTQPVWLAEAHAGVTAFHTEALCVADISVGADACEDL